MDPHREMCSVNIHSRSPSCLQKLERSVQKVVGLFDPLWRIGGFQMLHSLPGGPQQAKQVYTLKHFIWNVVKFQKGIKYAVLSSDRSNEWDRQIIQNIADHILW